MKKSYVYKYINHLIGKAILRYRMIDDGDRILVAVSGGKDSLTLLWFLRERLKWIPLKYELVALHIDLGFGLNTAGSMERFFRENGFEYKIIRTNIGPMAHSEKNRENPCFLCSRMRRKLIFETARELDCKKIAFGHHKDDVIETLFINILYGASISTMLPVQGFFKGMFSVIRPLYMVDEGLISRFFEYMKWPRMDMGCPSSGSSRRRVVKGILEKLYRCNHKIKGNIFHAMHNIRIEYLPCSGLNTG